MSTVERAKKLGLESIDDYIVWWSVRHRQHLMLAIEVAGRDQGGWANCHEIADVLRRNQGGPAAHDPAFLSMSVLAPWCRTSLHNDPGREGQETPPLLEKRRRIGAGLVDYRLTEDGREIMKRGMSL